MPHFKSLIWLDPEESLRRKRESNRKSAALEADTLTTRPMRRLSVWRGKSGEKSQQIRVVLMCVCVCFQEQIVVALSCFTYSCVFKTWLNQFYFVMISQLVNALLIEMFILFHLLYLNQFVVCELLTDSFPSFFIFSCFFFSFWRRKIFTRNCISRPDWGSFCRCLVDKLFGWLSHQLLSFFLNSNRNRTCIQ